MCCDTNSVKTEHPQARVIQYSDNDDDNDDEEELSLSFYINNTTKALSVCLNNENENKYGHLEFIL